MIFLIPYFNHPQSIGALVERLERYKIDILIIDDGSFGAGARALEHLQSTHLKIIKKDKNEGKGSAVKLGFKIAREMGKKAVFQIDSDCQHDLNKIDIFLKASQNNPQALILANPVFSNIPFARKYGRKISNFFVHLNTMSRQIKDCQCGFRIYPIALNLDSLSQNRMDFDIAVLIYAMRGGFELLFIDVEVQYRKNNVSHFKIMDNVYIAKTHAHATLSLPIYAFKKIFLPTKTQVWHKRNEVAGQFWLKISVFMAKYTPRFILKINIFFVTLFYFLRSKQDRMNLKKFYSNLNSKIKTKISPSPSQIFKHYYNFGEAIIDKILCYQGKITHKDLEVIGGENLVCERGQILLLSHFGNAEIIHAIGRMKYNFRVVSFVYRQNSAEFLNMLDAISSKKIQRIFVDEINVEQIIELKNLVDSGVNIALMGDRAAISSKRNIEMEFLNKNAIFPLGGFELARLLECGICALICDKCKDKYRFEVRLLESKITRNNIKKSAQKYVDFLEEKVMANPTQWFCFYDFWAQNGEKK